MQILCNPGLQTTKRFGTQRSAAINETLVNARDFGDVSVGGNEIAIRQNKTEIQIRMPCKVCFEFFYFHNIQISV